jgi:peptide/nickel transport system permease protein
MRHYVSRRLVQAPLVLWVITTIGFFLMRLAPGGPLAVYTLNSRMTSADKERLIHVFGLDQPLYVQYFKWLTGIIQGEWGVSFHSGDSVLEKILQTLPASLELALTALLISCITSIGIGVLAATNPNAIVDHLFTFLSYGGYSMPVFWIGFLWLSIFGVKLGWVPIGGRLSVDASTPILERLLRLLSPAVVLSVALTAKWTRQIKSSMQEELRQSYVRTARAKGLTNTQVVLGQVLRNALIPFVTIVGLSLPQIISSSIVTEVVFAWPGIGRLAWNSLLSRDYPTIQGVLILYGILVISSNLIVDVSYAVLDPRIRYS